MHCQLIATSIMFGLIAAGCTSGDSSTSGGPTTAGGPTTTIEVPDPVYGGSLVVGTTSEVDGLNPFSSQWSGPGFQMARAVLDPLAVMDAENNWQPYLAESFVPNEDFTEWTINLRDGVQFHNGDTLDADALVAFLNGVMASPLSSSGFPEIPTVIKASEMSVELLFTEPWSQMPVIFADQPGYVIAPEQIDSGSASHPIGTGPFVFDEWVRDDYFRATRNDNYWQEGLPYLNDIEFRPTVDPETRYRTLTNDQVDAVEASGITLDRRAELEGEGMRIIDDVDSTGATTLLMNLDATPVDDLRVRQAIVSAIDRESYRSALADESFELATQPHPSGSRWYVDNNYPEFNLDTARALVDEYEAENGPIEFRIMVINVSGQVQPAEFLQQTLSSVGIDATLDTLETTGFIQQFISGDYETVFLGSFLMPADPDGAFHFLTSDNADPTKLIKLNFTRHRSQEVDAALTRQRATDDPELRLEAWSEIWNVMAQELPYAWLLHPTMAFATQPYVYGLDGFTTPEGIDLPAINVWTPFYTSVYRTD